ncbi:MAG: hypothetical protein IPK82_13580 [Polyangiaceae bacterium]|nr:hypothetical protein [Polyangiaceae bacterium]
MFVSTYQTRSIHSVLGAANALIQKARYSSAPCFAASLVNGPAVILGAHQRASRVLSPNALTLRERGLLGVYRRASAGTAVYTRERMLCFALALPDVRTLYTDASFRTILNRNVRPFLKGLSMKAGPAHYFGRETVSVRKEPAMVLGFDVTPDGCVLIEGFIGWDAPVALPKDLASGDEQVLGRFRGHSPVALGDVVSAGVTPDDVAYCIQQAFVARGGGDWTQFEPFIDENNHSKEVELAPEKAGYTWLAPVQIPVGWLEKAVFQEGSQTRLWLGGDVLAPRVWLDELALRLIESGSFDSDSDPPLDGVSLAELVNKARV